MLSGEQGAFGEYDKADCSLSPLSFFLQTSMLSTDTDSDNQDDKANTPVRVSDWWAVIDCLTMQKVTITTVHSAKGLEWPVVFIPAGQLSVLALGQR
jgi:DNA helicase-2/ATP-dependent DNA helicase PcrA